MKTKLKNQKGFTIIEVLIVLAIAGLILLIVFLAVPALQRNSRNTTAKNDAAAVAGGISEYQGANNGALPTTITGTGDITYGALNTTTAKVQGTTVANVVTSAPAAAEPALGTVSVFLQRKCGVAATNTRAAAVYYSIETSSGTVQQCIDT